MSDCVGSSRSSPEPGVEILGAGKEVLAQPRTDLLSEGLLCTHGNFQISLCIPTLFPKTNDTRLFDAHRHWLLESQRYTAVSVFQTELLIFPLQPAPPAEFPPSVMAPVVTQIRSLAVRLISSFFFILPFCSDRILLFLLPPGLTEGTRMSMPYLMLALLWANPRK